MPERALTPRQLLFIGYLLAGHGVTEAGRLAGELAHRLPLGKAADGASGDRAAARRAAGPARTPAPGRDRSGGGATARHLRASEKGLALRAAGRVLETYTAFHRLSDEERCRALVDRAVSDVVLALDRALAAVPEEDRARIRQALATQLSTSFPIDSR